MARALALLWILALCGCLPYPTYRISHPEVTLTIRDARRRPLEGARVTLVSTEPPDGIVKSRETLETGPDGIARFRSERQLRLEVLFMYRGPIRFWNWCVQKEGFATFYTSGPRTKMFDDESAVVLRAGPSKACPAEFR